MSTTEQRRVIDSRGSFCPGPITDLFKAYRSSQLGDVIELLATDPAAKADVTAWTQKSGNELVSVVDEQGYTRITVKITKKR
ncbi:MAG: sulfurtransferase TusA family protein [Nitrososphaerota archaeon]|jgi:tRNA 2-thiouridine synthesizing protein A|nr:sulfurtransferase TusA family protein [Nitrososphaerota archaeon]MDG6959054.1 sulfurtransferase TusA family protein [Nitrososphaerota archaeon]MDG6965732.1 sulfurtransferase TusA family protein [Nitrososphaerota archaeon]MDG6968907.1 sulfurtransferase TusA family protein [Nitrososphaerota archaeon]MDG6973243.1 sulfurtransferase TusA family protein [Nitrososphaerota archaeon]